MELRAVRHHAALRFSPGDRAGKLTIIGVASSKHFRKGVAVVYRCRCDCGAEVLRDRQTLIKAKHSSCGCDRRGLGTMPSGWHAHPLAKSWRHMIDRCTNPKNKSYPDYGGRGIVVCERWIIGEGGFTGLECFVADMGARPPGKTLERQDTNGGYHPDNCVWADRTIQARNRRVVVPVTFERISRTLPEWAEATGIPYFTLHKRFKAGWSAEKALTTPVRSLRR
jgi:hypothetical protein